MMAPASGFRSSALVYIVALVVPVTLSVVGLDQPTAEFNTIVIWISASLMLVITTRDGFLVLAHAPIIGRFILGFGTLYWFWFEAVSLTLRDPPFPNTFDTYLELGAVISPKLVALGILCVNLFAVAVYAGWATIPVPNKIIARLAYRLDPKIGVKGDIGLFAMACLYWVPILVIFGGDFALAWDVMLEMRSATDGPVSSAGLLLHVKWIGIFAGAAALVRLLTGAPGSVLLKLITVLVLLPTVFLESSRYTLGFILLPALLILLNPRALDPRIVARLRILAFGLLVLTAIFILVQGAIRSQGGLARYLEGNTDRSLVMAGLEGGFIGHEHFTALVIAIDLIERRGEFFFEPQSPFFLTHFIPRQFWPDKPLSKSWHYYNEEVTKGAYFNVTPSIIGQYYLNWGIFGAFFSGLILAWFARIGENWWARWDKRQLLSAVVCGLWFAFIFFSFRYLWPLYFQYPLFGLLAYLVLSRRPAVRPTRPVWVPGRAQH